MQQDQICYASDSHNEINVTGNKYLLLAPLAILAGFMLTPGVMFLAAIASALVLGLFYKIERLAQNETTLQNVVHGGKKPGFIDGGSFTTKPSGEDTQAGQNVVSDGGSFKRTILI